MSFQGICPWTSDPLWISGVRRGVEADRAKPSGTSRRPHQGTQVAATPGPWCISKTKNLGTYQRFRSIHRWKSGATAEKHRFSLPTHVRGPVGALDRARTWGGRAAPRDSTPALHRFTILHTNDIQGHVVLWTGCEGEFASKTVGGFDRLAARVQEARSLRENHRQGLVIPFVRTRQDHRYRLGVATPRSFRRIERKCLQRRCLGRNDRRIEPFGASSSRCAGRGACGQ